MSAVRILELRSVRGTGGGPEKTILMGAALSDPDRFAITVCYIRDARDSIFAIGDRPEAVRLDYVEVLERHSMDTAIWPALRRLVRDRRIDIVHSHEYKTDLLAWLLSRTDSIVPLATVHGWTGSSTRERLLYYPVDKRLLSRFPRVIAVSSQIRRELERAGADPVRITVLLNAIDPERFSRDRSRTAPIRHAFGIGTDETVIGAVGRLEVQKRFDLLLEAFASIRKSRAGLRLLVAGDGSQRPVLEAQARCLGLDPSRTFCGHCDDIAGFHHALDVFVQSSTYEGTPNAVLEAMALETPVVATDAGGTSEVVRDGIEGIIVPPGDPRALARAIEQVLQDRPAAHRRAALARTRVEDELSFRARTAALERTYLELAERKTRARGRGWNAWLPARNR
jgi:glycosyltransferase involved in cell wall biosynthesis